MKMGVRLVLAHQGLMLIIGAKRTLPACGHVRDGPWRTGDVYRCSIRRSV